MPRLSLQFLGTFKATLDDVPIKGFESNKARALLVYLAVESDRPHRREKLAGLLWPDMAESDARRNLRHILYNLRKVLRDHKVDAPFLFIDRQSIQFNITSNVQLDVKVFTDAIATTKEHPHSSLESCDVCMFLLSEAVRRYEGEFLDGFSLSSDIFENWMVVQREKLHIQVLDALAHLAAYHEKKGEYQKAQGYAQRQVEMEPWRESAHRQLIRAYALSGHRGRALAQYETCRRVLGIELSIEPEVETTALYERIQQAELQSEASEKTPQRSHAPVSLPSIPHNLPPALTPFIAREDLLEEIVLQINDPMSRLLTLLGPGGSGKTRLALEAARRLLIESNHTHFDDGVFFIPLTAVKNVESVIPALAQSVGFSFYGDGKSEDQLLGYLKRKQMLLILDNYEELVSDVGFIVNLLDRAPGVKVLVTSRVRMNLTGEILISVPGMEYPSLITDIATTREHSAVKLFLLCARRVQPGFVLDADNVADVVHVCKLVNGIPLGILLATAWLQMLTPEEIGCEIARSLDFLKVDWQEMPERQRSMRAVFDHSWKLLSTREHEILYGLSVFRGGCTREAAQAVTGATLREMLGLISKSQLHRTHEGRYEMHELLRQYAEEQLMKHAAHEKQIRDRHCTFYAENLFRWEEELKGQRQHEAILEITTEIENIRLAIERMLEYVKIDWLEHAVNAVGRYYELINLYQEGTLLFQNIAGRTSQFSTEGTLTFRARVLAWQTYLTEQSGNVVKASETLRESLSIIGLSGILDGELHEPAPPVSESEQRLRAFVYWTAVFPMFHKDFIKARWFAEHSLALYRKLDDRWQIARTLNVLTGVYSLLGLHVELEPLYQEMLAIAQSIGDYRTILQAYQNLSEILIDLVGKVEEGERLMKLSSKIVYETGVSLSADFQLARHSSNTHIGNYAQASVGVKADITRFEDAGISLRVADGKIILCRCYMHLGRYEEVYALAKNCMDECIEKDYPLQLARCCLTLSNISLVWGRYMEASSWLDRAETTYCNLGSRNKFSYQRGLLALNSGDIEDALIRFHTLITAIVAAHHWREMVSSLPYLAYLQVKLGHVEGAIAVYSLALQQAFIANSRWFYDIAGKHIEKAAEALPPDVVEAAKARGQELDIWETAESLLEELNEGLGIRESDPQLSNSID